MRQGLRTLLEEQPDFQVIGEAGNGVEALQLVQSLKPDVLVLDMVMPGMNGIEITKQVPEYSKACSVVILSMYGTEGYVHEAVRAGAKAYVLKKSTAGELVQAVREVVAGRRYLSQSLSERAISSYVKQTEPGALDPYQALTGRERQVLQMVVRGNTSAEIGAALSVSPRTAEFHRANIMRKLALHSQSELIHYCLRFGLLANDD